MAVEDDLKNVLKLLLTIKVGAITLQPSFILGLAGPIDFPAFFIQILYYQGGDSNELYNH